MNRICFLNVCAAAGGGLIATASTADKVLEVFGRFLPFLSQEIYIVLGVFLAGVWGYEKLCRGGQNV